MRSTRPVLMVGLLAASLLVDALPAASADSAADRERAARAVAALTKLEGVDVEQNEALKSAILRVLESIRGTPDFVRLVRKFDIKGQEQGLLEIALAHPTATIGVDAARLLLDHNAGHIMGPILGGPDTNAAVNLANALGHTRAQQALPWLEPLLTNKNATLPARRQAAQSMARTEAGARTLLTLATQDALPIELRLPASLALNQAQWPEIREQAATVLPLPRGRDAEPLPPLPELLARTGNTERGKEVFSREETGCANCHRVHGAGRDVGPDLSEIGSKLGKDALYESIFNPSAGISFGYEAWTLELASGDEAYGLVVSETAEAIAMKDTGGIVTDYPKKEVRSRRQMELSLMPADLQLTLSADELVDLIEFLASLKK